MIPSLVVSEIRSALVEFLSSTFALTDDEARDALAKFLSDNAEGIFRGPYLRVRTPFRSVNPDTWESPLGWQPDWFTPYIHQAEAFQRLSSAKGHSPEPTLVTTGTGSGKTECFLMPVLDHCARMRDQKIDGIKALILYPMNALASDQAGRIAKLINTEPHLQGLRAGIYVGDSGRHSAMSEDNIIDQRDVLRANPPDILLTNYKMLDFLLLRAEDHDLWAVNSPTTLQYVVLDEFHTYDGAQGTDVAMLLRRLGATLKMSLPDQPLGDATPVATSATLGSSPSATIELREFAGKVFGTEFDIDSVIGESRQTAQEACKPADFFLPIPNVEDLVGLTDIDDIANAFCHIDEDPLTGDLVQLGEKLLAHTLTHGVLSAVGDGSKSWDDAVAEIVARAPNWGKSMLSDPHLVEAALAQFVRLLSIARRNDDGNERPLFSVEVQLWIREVTRLLRTVSTSPSFRWRDSGQAETQAEIHDETPDVLELPAIYCRRCGAAGWMSITSESTHALSDNAAEIGKASIKRSPLVRALMIANKDDSTARWLNPATMLVESTSTPGSVAVHMSGDEDDAKRSTCPACGESRAVRFLGSAVAGLASVTINTLFGSNYLEEQERKLLAFTDSVQDASHRASFFSGRTHRMNLRSLMSRIVQEAGQISLADLGQELYSNATTPRERFGLIPPDLSSHQQIKTVWSETPDPVGVEVLVRRLGFEADIEFGLRARVGRTLELSQAAVASVEIDGLDDVVDLIGEDIEAQLGERLDPNAVAGYLRGLTERLRLRGGLRNPLLNRFVEEGGDHWWLWGGRPDGLPPFTFDQGRPSFFTTASKTDLDSVTALAQTPTWLVDWGVRTLGVEPAQARSINERAMAILANETEAVVAHQNRATIIYGLDRRSVLVHDIPSDDGATSPIADADSLSRTLVWCSMCGHLHVTPPALFDDWVGMPCLRYRCGGHFVAAPARQQRYYRKLYRSGSTTRVVTGEHTGLLGRTERENLETSFKAGTAPDAPNVVTATSTLEMGIDIGDLSAVMLTSVPRTPASYIQRVGRAGRLTGNSLVTTFVRSDTHSLYYLSEPEAMLAGEVRSPNCYLDALETQQRQFVAYLIDRLADGTIDGPALPRQANSLLVKDAPEDSFLATVINSGEQHSEHIDDFIASFGDQISEQTRQKLRDFSNAGLRTLLSDAASSFQQDLEDLRRRVQRLAKAIDRLEEAEASGTFNDDDKANLRDLRGQRKQLANLMRDARGEYALSAMGRLGLLPNYNLGGDMVNLVASMWSVSDDGHIETETVEIARSARLAVRELAPGNSFYAKGHRHRIDAVKIGTADAPLTEDWRICPDCDFVGRTNSDSGDSNAVNLAEQRSVCPRCTSPGFADTGAVFKMLRLSEVYASSSEEDARVFDESDDRERKFFNTVVLVDGDPATISEAWRLTDRVFGAELIGRAKIRTLNLGPTEREGEARLIGGTEHRVPGFTICSHCGAAEEVRDDRNGQRPERLHQGWCRVRSGSVKASSDTLVLFHELTTEAIRILLPISLFEIDERLASFKAALLLGLREDFGGDPDHLEVVLSDAPNRQGAGRRRFLVLFDQVPGGTGYLSRLGDPDRMRSILEKARNAIARCPCTGEGRQACHRCLLGVVDRNDYELVRRDLALELLDAQLDDWNTEAVDSISELEIGQVEESELERRFRSALQKFAESDSSTLSYRSLPPKNPPYQSFELTFTSEQGEVARYRVDEQEGLGTTPSVLPDFVFTRLDQPDTPVAVFCDGFEYHGSENHNTITIDAEKRRGIRSDDKLVWNLTWDDVTDFHNAVLGSPRREAKLKPLLRGGAKKVATRVQHETHPEGFQFDTLDKNPMALLLDYLSRPSKDDWRGLAQSAVAGAAQAGKLGQADADQLPGLVHSALSAGDQEAIVPQRDPVAFAGRYVTANDLVLTVFLDIRPGRQQEQRWTAIAVLPDDEATVANDPKHRERWRDWLQWANVLQFLNGPGQDVIITGTSGADNAGADDLTLLLLTDGEAASAPGDTATTPASDAGADSTDRPAVAISSEMREELDFLDDDNVRALVKVALAAGAPDFVAGIELSEQSIEAGWKAAKVGIVPMGSETMASDGWTIRPVGEWTIEELLRAIEETD